VWLEAEDDQGNDIITVTYIADGDAGNASTNTNLR